MDDRMLISLSEFFKSFSDYTRLRILSLLSSGEAKVSYISEQLSISQSLVSHQLKNLKDAKFVKSRREGKTILYHIADDHIGIILKYAIEHIKEGGIYEKE